MPRVEGFRIHRELGHGGMGTVYLARRAGSRRLGALKLIATTAARDPRSRARFAREIAAVSRVHHPNVVRLLEHGVEGGGPFALFEHVDGCDLGCLGSPLPWPVVVHLARQLARAIAAVHDAGLVHRDIKPANVMVSRTCRLTLIDFGLAKPAAGDEWDDEDIAAMSSWGGCNDDLTEAGAVAGTPRYLAPEVWRGEPASFASDLFAFGLVMLQMLTGRSPSTETGPSALDHLDIPRLLRDLVARCLERDPAARPQRACAAIVILDALDAQPGLIVRACMGGGAARRRLAIARTRFVGVGCADATLPTDAAAPVIARVHLLPDRHTRGSALPDRHRLPAPRSVHSTGCSTLAYPMRLVRVVNSSARASGSALGPVARGGRDAGEKPCAPTSSIGPSAAPR